MPHPYLEMPRPAVFGHRGASGERPENTLPAFELALELGADALELDVHGTRDGEIVVLHDGRLERTTDGQGPVAELRYEQVRKLDAGHHFTTDGGRSHPFRGRGIRVPRLQEVFDAFPEARCNIEIKASEAWLIDATLQCIGRAGRSELTLLAAERDETMQRIRQRCGALARPPATGAALGEVVAFVRAALGECEPPSGPMALQIPPEFAGRPLVTPALVGFAHAQGVAVHVWTVNEPPEIERLLDLDVDGIMSDFPGRVRRIVDARGGASR